MSFQHLIKRAAKFTIDNSPTILTSVGVVGAITTAYLAGRASFQAADIIRLKEAEDEEAGETYFDDPRELMKKRVELVWRLYVPAVSTGLATVVCIIGANHIGSRRAAGLAAAYSITEKAFEEYKAKVIEKVGEKKEEQVRADIIQDRINAGWSWDDDDSIVIHGKPDGEVCYDKFSDRYVWHTAEGIRGAQNDLNEGILKNGYATLADFYYLLDMPAPPWSQEIGWNSDDMLKVRFCSALTPAGRPVLAFEFRNEPVRDYGRFH